jgi:PEP-CTERM motif
MRRRIVLTQTASIYAHENNWRIDLMIRKMALAALLFAATTAAAQASESTIPFTAFGSALDGTNFLNSTEITSAFAVTTNAGTGIYSGIPLGSSFSGPTLIFSNLSAFTFTGTEGTFTSNGNSGLDEIVNKSADFLEVYLRGDFNGVDSSLDLTATTSPTGGGTQMSWTLFTPALPPPVPEPSTMVMGLTGIAGGFFLNLLRRRRARKSVS